MPWSCWPRAARFSFAAPAAPGPPATLAQPVREILRVDVSPNRDDSIGSLEMEDWACIAQDKRPRDAANLAFDAIRACAPSGCTRIRERRI
jgi:hypothetical protein